MLLFGVLLSVLVSQYSAWHRQYGWIDFVVEKKEGQLTATFGNMIMVFEGVTDARGKVQGKLPVRGGPATDD